MRQKGDDWTEGEVKRLLEMDKSGMTHAEIAQTTGRTKDSVRYMLRKRTARQDKRIWSQAEIDVLLANAGKPLEEIHKLFPNRTQGAVKDKLGLVTGHAVNRPSRLVNAVPPIAEFLRPLNVPFATPSTAWLGRMAIRTESGVVPYVPSIHGGGE
jgi:hypothetical protein